ncbi:MAG TPA: hypothetical protein VJM57_00995 [Thermodesulfobacteriota bacterium]|nr:hypothetical protein [Thermodesulfobacteriota bacterium]
MLSNYITEIKSRTESHKDVSVEERNELVALAEKTLAENFETYHWNVSIHGIVIRLVTNSSHLYDFWVENWYAAPRTHSVLPHGLIYAVKGVEGFDPFAYYNHETRTAVFINTEYYGQCKSWALGIAADILETQHNVHSIHGSCAVLDGKGVVIIAPTGTGKSTHTWGLMQLPYGKIHSDDWIFVRYKKGLAMADISERKFYLRTDMVRSFPGLARLLERCKCENVLDDDFASFANSRAILDPEWIGGPDKFVERAVVKSVILLRRDGESAPEVKLSAEEAVRILEEGRYQVLAGAGANIGAYAHESFYNPYLLVKRPEIQKDFFSRLFEASSCHILNTGVETVEESQARIRRIIKEA